jgi:hypothetical protein
MTIAVIADIVASRELPDRAAAQAVLEASVVRVDDMVPATRRLTPVVGDELQGEYATVEEAISAVLLLRLSLPEGLDCRFGIGEGASYAIPSSAGDLPEGPAWWAAREAIERVHALAQRTVPSARTWVTTADAAPPVVLNAYLLARDELVGAMSARTRRLVLGRCLGRTQRELAADEGITQSAVSQALASAGAAGVVEGYLAITGSQGG